MDNLDALWDALLEIGAEEQTLQVVTDINGYNEDTMYDILYALTGYRNFEQIQDAEGYHFDFLDEEKDEDDWEDEDEEE